MITVFSLYGITATANHWQNFIFLLTLKALEDHKEFEIFIKFSMLWVLCNNF